MTSGLRVRPGIEQIQPYVAGVTDDELRRRFGVQRVVKLNANENALGPSPLAMSAIADVVATLHLYPDGASENLRVAIADFHHVDVENVIAGNGSDNLIKLISETFLSPGDDIVTAWPSFSQYVFAAQIMGANVRTAPLTDTFDYDVEHLAAAVTPQTKLIYVCSPNNPTGTTMSAAEAQWLLQNVPSDVMVVFDLAYSDWSMRVDGVQATASLLADPRVITLHTFSKLYGLAGLRIGYAIAHAGVWAYVHRIREPFNVNRIAQRAAVAALQDDRHRSQSQAMAKFGRTQYMKRCAAAGLPITPSQANFVLVRTGNGAETVSRMLARGVMVRAGFTGLEEYVRITVGTEEQNELCLEALVDKSTLAL